MCFLLIGCCGVVDVDNKYFFSLTITIYLFLIIVNLWSIWLDGPMVWPSFVILEISYLNLFNYFYSGSMIMFKIGHQQYWNDPILENSYSNVLINLPFSVFFFLVWCCTTGEIISKKKKEQFNNVLATSN